MKPISEIKTEAQKWLDIYTTNRPVYFLDVRQSIIDLLAALEASQAALQKYKHHLNGCINYEQPWPIDTLGSPCDCGLAEALEAGND